MPKEFNIFKRTFRDLRTTITQEVREARVPAVARPIDWIREPAVLRVYCSGTLFDETNRGELIAGLYHGDPGVDQIDKLHLKGPGKAKHSSKIAGAIDGYVDMKRNVRTATDWLFNRVYEGVKNGHYEFNIPVSGWSRGAVTALWITNQLENVKLKVLNELIKKNEITEENAEFLRENFKITAKLLAVDPVPGPTNSDGTMLGEISRSSGRRDNRTQMQVVTPNVVEVNVLYAEDENRGIMQPIVPKLLPAESVVRAQTLPGKHASLVQRPKIAREELQGSAGPVYDRTFMSVAYFSEIFYKQNGIEIDMEQSLFMPARERGGSHMDNISRLDAIAFMIQQEARTDRPESMSRERQHVTSHEELHNEDYSLCLMKDYMVTNYPNLFEFMNADPDTFEEMMSDTEEAQTAAGELQELMEELRDKGYVDEFTNKFGSTLLDEERIASIQRANEEVCNAAPSM